jgi:hypothetical protein
VETVAKTRLQGPSPINYRREGLAENFCKTYETVLEKRSRDRGRSEKIRVELG